MTVRGVGLTDLLVKFIIEDVVNGLEWDATGRSENVHQNAEENTELAALPLSPQDDDQGAVTETLGLTEQSSDYQLDAEQANEPIRIPDSNASEVLDGPIALEATDPHQSFLWNPRKDKNTTTNPFGSAIDGVRSGPALPPTSITFAQTPRMKLASMREVFLLHKYTNLLAPWADIFDSRQHCRTLVPRLCLHIPMMRYAVLALSSRHQAILTKGDELEANYYHGKSLELLIEALSAPEETYDETHLTTVAILRHYEELGNDDDHRTHILGTSRLLNAVSKFSLSGGLGETASWWILRQDIYVALVHKQCLSVDLSTYDQASAFDLQDDGAYSNMMVLLVARILQLLYSSSHSTSIAAWETLETEVDAWDKAKPDNFQPIFYEESDLDRDRAFPTVCMVSSASSKTLVSSFRRSCHNADVRFHSGRFGILSCGQGPAQNAQAFEHHSLRFRQSKVKA